jgi:hypothetical protein
MSEMAGPKPIRLAASRSRRAAADRRPPTWERMLLGCLIVTSVILLALTVAGTARARADSVAYPIDVTARPGYDFANAEAALTYGNQLCDEVSQGRTYRSAAHYQLQGS